MIEMTSDKLLSAKSIFRPRFLIALTLVLFAYVLYGANMVTWRNSPDFGWRTMYDSGPNVVAQVFGSADAAGLRVGDEIKAINGKSYSTFDELYFKVRNDEPGSVNTHTVVRDGKTFEFSIPTGRLGLTAVLLRSLPVFIIGLIYAIMGVLVFIMKPQAPESWLFLVMTFFMGMEISFIAPSDLMNPLWFFHIRQLIDVLLPAPMIHLALRFPKPRSFLLKRRWLLIIPYLLSLILFFLLSSTAYWNTPPLLDLINNAYLLSGVLIFLVSMIWNIFKDTSIIRLQSKVILLGISLGFLIPTVELLSRNFWGICLFPDPTLGYSFFLIFFPLSIGYTIVKHNLFDVDVYIKRAVGYGIMTVLVGTAYFSTQMIIRSLVLKDYSERVYPILFAILVVFLFNPINRRVQQGVERLFYRKKFDYKETVISVSHALTSVLNLTEVIKRIINTVRKEMFIDKAGVILLDPQKRECQTLFIGDETNNIKSSEKECIKYGDPFVDLLSKNKKLITIYDITEDPRYRDIKHTCSERFSRMGVSMVLPLIYQGDVTGALALGYKKSGHFYTREDIDLLDTLASHGAVAIENAKLAEQMKKEETVRTNLARYLSPQIVDQVIKKDVQVNLGGDRKIVTVLFSDIRNFTRISETQRPDQLVQILNEYFTEMAKIIFENQGSLDKYIGDAIVAVFGSLIPLENSANNAVQAAVQMMNRMPVLNEKWMKEYGFSMDIGIGINTGEVFLGNIGSPERMEFTVIGDTVNVASRFSGLAQPSQILITREALNSLGNNFNHKELPAAAVKGKTEKLEVYEIPYS